MRVILRADNYRKYAEHWAVQMLGYGKAGVELRHGAQWDLLNALPEPPEIPYDDPSLTRQREAAKVRVQHEREVADLLSQFDYAVDTQVPAGVRAYHSRTGPSAQDDLDRIEAAIDEDSSSTMQTPGATPATGSSARSARGHSLGDSRAQLDSATRQYHDQMKRWLSSVEQYRKDRINLLLELVETTSSEVKRDMGVDFSKYAASGDSLAYWELQKDTVIKPSEHTKAELMDRFRGIRQGPNEGLVTFISRVEVAADQAIQQGCQITDAEQVHHARAKMNEHWKLRFGQIFQEGMTWQSVRREARRCETHHGTVATSTSASTTRSAPSESSAGDGTRAMLARPEKRQRTASGPTHEQKKKSAKAARSAEGTSHCANCGSAGHTNRKCPAKPATCSVCGLMHHLTRYHQAAHNSLATRLGVSADKPQTQPAWGRVDEQQQHRKGATAHLASATPPPPPPPPPSELEDQPEELRFSELAVAQSESRELAYLATMLPVPPAVTEETNPEVPPAQERPTPAAEEHESRSMTPSPMVVDEQNATAPPTHCAANSLRRQYSLMRQNWLQGR